MKHTRFTLPSATVATTLVAGMLVGCASTSSLKGESLSDIRSNPAPGLDTEDKRYSDVYSQIAVGNNDNLRKLTSDNMRFWLTDHPSRMSPYPSSR
jgi:type IV pilus biogenesis protein CpaD/CtpE